MMGILTVKYRSIIFHRKVASNRKNNKTRRLSLFNLKPLLVVNGIKVAHNPSQIFRLDNNHSKSREILNKTFKIFKESSYQANHLSMKNDFENSICV